MRFLGSPRGMSQPQCSMCELWLLPPVASYFKRGQKIAAFGVEMEEQGMKRSKCACSISKCDSPCVPCGDVMLLPICRCAPQIVVIRLYGSISISGWRLWQGWHSLGWHPPPVVSAGCDAWHALSMSFCSLATFPRDGAHLCPTLHGVQHLDLPSLLQPHPSRPHAAEVVLPHCLFT